MRGTYSIVYDPVTIAVTGTGNFGMVFPESQRVIYAKNTLADVICELRFPPILKIEASAPAEFQEKIRLRYPFFEKKSKGPELPAGIPQEILRDMLSFGSLEYEFISNDGKWSVGLSKQSIALTTRAYTRWEDFKEHLSLVLDALITNYSPAFFQRVGLRYRNFIIRSQLGLADVPWSQLLIGEIIGEIADPKIGPSVLSAVRQTQIALGEAGSVNFSHYLAMAKNEESGSTEQAYVIDADFFNSEKTEAADVTRKLDALKSESGRLFRWCITEDLHKAMGPTAVEQ